MGVSMLADHSLCQYLNTKPYFLRLYQPELFHRYSGRLLMVYGTLLVSVITVIDVLLTSRLTLQNVIIILFCLLGGLYVNLRGNEQWFRHCRDHFDESTYYSLYLLLIEFPKDSEFRTAIRNALTVNGHLTYLDYAEGIRHLAGIFANRLNHCHRTYQFSLLASAHMAVLAEWGYSFTHHDLHRARPYRQKRIHSQPVGQVLTPAGT